MVRLPRFFGKKRGHRRTGSQTWASLGDAAFHTLLVLVGLVFAALLVSGVAVPEWRLNHDFRPTRCTVLAKGVLKRTATDPAGVTSSTWQPVLRVRYDALDKTLESWNQPARSTLAARRDDAIHRLGGWRLGGTVTGWFDPTAPQIIVLERGYNWPMWLLALLLPGALVAFGGAGLARSLRRWGRSEERRAAASSLAEIFDPLKSGVGRVQDFPGIPTCDDLNNSPGTLLRYRLPVESPESWTLLGFGLFAVLWNSVLAVLVVNAGIDLLGGRGDWLLLALLVPFAVIGIAGIVVFVRSLLVATAVGTTQMEISLHPLRPGGHCEVLLGQGGAGTFRSLDITLQLEEQATFRQGTDTRTERVTVWRQPLQSWRGLQLTPGTRFEARTTVVIPEAAMHSFSSEHNAVRWSLVVHGEPVRWPPFTRVFPIVVLPATAAGSEAGGPSAEVTR